MNEERNFPHKRIRSLLSLQCMLTPFRHEISLADVTLHHHSISLSKPQESVTAEMRQNHLDLLCLWKKVVSRARWHAVGRQIDARQEEQFCVSAQPRGFRMSVQGIKDSLAKSWLIVTDAIGQPSTNNRLLKESSNA